MAKLTREAVLALISKHSGIPVDQLNDETVIGNKMGDLDMDVAMNYGKSLIVNSPSTFTVANLVTQLVN